MRVSFDRIKHEPLTLSFSQADGWMREILHRLGDKSAHEGDIQAQVELSATGTTVRVRGQGKAVITLSCARCLEAVTRHLAPEFDLGLIPAEDEPLEPELELTEDDIEEHTYDGHEIDVGELVNEQFVLEEPFRTLCTPECAGLCPVCGGNRNQQPCSCSQPTGHPGLAALADIDIEGTEE